MTDSAQGASSIAHGFRLTILWATSTRGDDGDSLSRVSFSSPFPGSAVRSVRVVPSQA